MEDVEKAFDRRIDGGVQLLVFNKHSEFRQSNIGVAADAENNIGGTAMLVGSKLFTFGQQAWTDVEIQVKSGLAQLLFNQIMYGGNWQEALRNSTSTTFPTWFSEGLASYISQPWNAEVAVHIGDAALNRTITQAHQAGPDEAHWVGHAVWKYIADIFGPMVVSNTLYMTRVSRSLEKGFQYATGMDLATVLEEANRYHLEWNDPDAPFPTVSNRRERRQASKNPGDLPIRISSEATVKSVWFHPDGNRFAWATEERGQIKVWLGDLSGAKAIRLGKHGHKIDRIQSRWFPAFAWHPNGQLLSYTIEDGAQNKLITVNIETLESSAKDIFQIDKILSMTYAPDGNTMIWSGLRNGQSDLYLYQVLGNNQMALWNDPYNDLDPVYSSDGQYIWFASNRPDTDLETFILGEPLPEQHDLFRLNWQEKIPRIEPWTQTPNTDERQPQLQGPDEVTYLAENTDGSQERWVSWRDSAVAFIDTTIHYRWFTQTRLAQTLAAPAHSFQFIAERGVIGFEHQLCEHVYWNEIPADKSTWKSTTDQPESSEAENSLDLDWEWKPKSGEADIRNYQFGPWTDPDKPSSNQENTSGQAGEMSADSEPDDPAAKQTEWKPFELPKPVNYRRNYAIESVTGQLDNSFGTNFYQAYSGEIAVQPGLGGLSRISMSDLFEDRDSQRASAFPDR
jgi:WD40 repeat protein